MDSGMGRRTDVQVGEPDSRPCFGQILFRPLRVELKIPPMFMKHLENQNLNKVILKSPCGTSWEVELKEEHDGDTYLAKNWKKFVKNHQLEDLDYLVFKYNGDLCFDVVIYDKSGWKRSYGSASAFMSPYPHFKHIISCYNIGSKSSLVVPKDFASKHIRISKPKTVVLRNPDGVSWEINILTSGAQPLMSKGWKTFAEDNSLKIGDTCIFELVAGDVMKVHFFRS